MEVDLKYNLKSLFRGELGHETGGMQYISRDNALKVLSKLVQDNQEELSSKGFKYAEAYIDGNLFNSIYDRALTYGMKDPQQIGNAHIRGVVNSLPKVDLKYVYRTPHFEIRQTVDNIVDEAFDYEEEE